MTRAAAAGYSGTPLAKKLGVTTGCRLLTIGAPADYRRLLEPLPDGVAFVSRASASVDVVHLFVTSAAVLRTRLTTLRATLRPDAAVWVSWPKRSSGVPTTVTEDTIRATALPLGFVDVKVCAVNDVWSGLKLVVRKTLRPA